VRHVNDFENGVFPDRIDIHIEVLAVQYQDMASNEAAEASALRSPRECSAREIRCSTFHALPATLSTSTLMELSQNLKALLQDIGESSVLLQLCMRLHGDADWRVYRNYAEHGCDLVLIGKGTQIRIEVKTRQNVIKKHEERDALHFTLSASERASAHFVVAYWFDRSAYFIIPASDLRETRSDDKLLYKIVAYYSRVKCDFTDYSKAYHEAWHYILDATKTH
jgi:hypothetical protein